MAQVPSSSNELSPAMQDAVRLLQAGKTVEAEELMLRHAEQVRQEFGKASRQDAITQNELGSVLLNVGQLDRAIDAFSEAVSGPAAADEPGMRDRLTFLMNLGQGQQMARRLDDAEETLHKGLEGRESFYGREHAGYAFGLEPLAEVTFALGKVDVAKDMMDEVVRNFWRNGHGRVAGAIAIRAMMRKSAGADVPAFNGLEKLPRAMIEEVGRQAVSRIARTEDLKTCRGMIAELQTLLCERLGESHPQTLQTLIASTNIERKLGKEGDAAARIGTTLRLIRLFDAEGRSRDALQSVLGLAMAYGETGSGELAVAAYEDALLRVEHLGDRREKSQVLRNYGLYLVELKHEAQAEQRLREAIAEGEKSGDEEMIARAMIGLGIFLQHGGKPQEGRPLLAEALPMLDPAHPDAITCRSHLQAIDRNGSCGCGDLTDAVADAFREFVMSRAPAGLLKGLDVELKDNDFSIDVHLNRKATQEEMERLQRVTQHALEEFGRKMRAED